MTRLNSPQEREFTSKWIRVERNSTGDGWNGRSFFWTLTLQNTSFWKLLKMIKNVFYFANLHIRGHTYVQWVMLKWKCLQKSLKQDNRLVGRAIFPKKITYKENLTKKYGITKCDTL